MSEEREQERTARLVARAKMKRTAVISQIRAIHSMALRVSTEPDLASEFLVNVADLDVLWNQFRTEDESVLDCLAASDLLSEYSPDMVSEVRLLINAAKNIAQKLIPSGAEAIDLSYIQKRIGPTPKLADDLVKSFSRLPEIPLPSFDGDFRHWPMFRDRFSALVDSRPNLPQIEKMYYLIGCLRGPAADAVRGIPISADNYDLIMSTLVDRFHRPRLVATSLVDKLLHAASMSQESLHELNEFLCLFSEGNSLLETLNIPDLGSFILFSIAFRCLPVSTRKLFESTISSDYPSISQLLEFVQSRVTILELVGEPRKRNMPVAPVKSGRSSGPPRKGGDYSKFSSSKPMSLVTSKVENSCPCCSGGHVLTSCTRFKSWDVKERVQWTRDKHRCFNCFSDDHWSPKCKLKPACRDCTRRHNTLLHGPTDDERIQNEPTTSGGTSLCASVPRAPINQATSVMLGTALVHMRDRSGTWQTMRALVDSASQISAVTVACADRLGLKRSRWTAPISGLSGVSVVNVQGRVECTVQPRFASEPVFSIHAWVLPNITANLPRKTLPSVLKNKYSNLALADPSFHVSSPIDVLLGGDVYASIMDGRKFSIGDDLPAAFSSVFGWILIGPVHDCEVGPCLPPPVSMSVSIEELVERFWRAEEPEVAPSPFTNDGRCEQIFCDNFVRLPSGRFSVPLPFRTPVSDDTFVGSRAVAVRRFEALERKLSANPRLQSLYVQFMAEYISLGHMSIARSPGCYFIPHHAIYRPEIDARKIRVVFDASARGGHGLSLNNCLFSGPKLQQDIVDILIRFRVHKHVFTTDICKMYRQIEILPEFRKYQHVLWRASPHDKLLEYELNTVTYGMNCAPYLALRVLQVIASDDCAEFDHVHNALTRQTYVDDICVGADTIPEVLQLQSDLTVVLQKSGLELKKWASNTPAVLDAVPSADRVGTPMSFENADSYGTKVLGLEWRPDGDYLSCALSLEPSPVYTKRGILSLVARIFDPLGVFGPAVFLAKTIMQRTWQYNLSWDEPLPAKIHAGWSAFISDLPALLTIRVPRYINARKRAPCYLLGFCDASQLGYAAVIYVRMVDVSADTAVFLIGTKTKLAPVKQLTIPRLELNAALLLARWLGRICTTLAPLLNIVGMRAWTDSTIVLSWLTVPHESFKVYVSNRVHQIRTLLPECGWQHIDSLNNPADCASRGLMPTDLAQHELYWHGPRVAYNDPSDWDAVLPSFSLTDLPELRPVSCVTQQAEVCDEWFTRFSHYDHMLRVVAHMLRFIAACRRMRSNKDTSTFLHKTELDSAVRVLVKESQRVHFGVLFRELSTGSRVSSKPLARLAPFIDPEGVIRVGGRLRHSLLNYDCKHPILLAKKSHYAVLLCRRWHLMTCHAGPRVLSALIARQFWILSLRSVLHSVLTNCHVCVRFDAKPFQPLMADLPSSRVQPWRPFDRVGIDFAGPLQMRETRLRKSRNFKIYIAVFICFSIKAVHLEVVTDLSTDAFLAAFDRFVARRGLPSDIFSDCGTNFVGADKQLRALIHSPVGQAAIAESRAVCHWHFNPPSAPHFGGLWEAAVRSTKRLLIRVIGTHVFTYEEFTTVLARVEAVLNSRPITPASTDPHDLDCLTPGHFLIGQPMLAVPPRSAPDTVRNLSNRWKLLDQCHQAFWRRWSAEYLTTLQARAKWTENTKPIKIGDMVVIMDNQNPPLLWRLGRVVELLPGTDGHIRVVRVLTRAGIVTRPVVKLVPLPTD